MVFYRMLISFCIYFLVRTSTIRNALLNIQIAMHTIPYKQMSHFTAATYSEDGYVSGDCSLCISTYDSSFLYTITLKRVECRPAYYFIISTLRHLPVLTSIIICHPIRLFRFRDLIQISIELRFD